MLLQTVGLIVVITDGGTDRVADVEDKRKLIAYWLQ